MRFIFGLKGKNYHKPITPYLKELHFLPVRQRIIFKIALLTYKSLHNIAPAYISDLIHLRSPNTYYSLRRDTDHFLITPDPQLNLKRTTGAFTAVAPKIWNDLPYSLRSQGDMNSFKKLLKTYLFQQAFGGHRTID